MAKKKLAFHEDKFVDQGPEPGIRKQFYKKGEKLPPFLQIDRPAVVAPDRTDPSTPIPAIEESQP